MRVNEIFYSLQGEGVHAGRPAIFVRLSGCNRACPFCDTDFSHFAEMSESQIIAEIENFPAEIVIFTGGEPALQLSDSLVKAVQATGRKVHIETNGSLPVPDSIDWITCSPKTPPFNIQRVDELKVLMLPGTDPEQIAAQLPSAALKH